MDTNSLGRGATSRGGWSVHREAQDWQVSVSRSGRPYVSVNNRRVGTAQRSSVAFPIDPSGQLMQRSLQLLAVPLAIIDAYERATANLAIALLRHDTTTTAALRGFAEEPWPGGRPADVVRLQWSVAALLRAASGPDGRELCTSVPSTGGAWTLTPPLLIRYKCWVRACDAAWQLRLNTAKGCHQAGSDRTFLCRHRRSWPPQMRSLTTRLS